MLCFQNDDVISVSHLAPDTLTTQPGPGLSSDPSPWDTELVETLTAASAVHEAVLGPEARAGAHKAEVRPSLRCDEASAGDLDVLCISWLPELHCNVTF